MWLTCLHCGQTYYGNGKFCTSKCEENFINPPVYKPIVIKKLCKFCGEELKGDKRFYCSEACKLENQKGQPIYHKVRERSPEKCLVCFGPMPESYIGCCSKECQIAFNGNV